MWKGEQNKWQIGSLLWEYPESRRGGAIGRPWQRPDHVVYPKKCGTRGPLTRNSNFDKCMLRQWGPLLFYSCIPNFLSHRGRFPMYFEHIIDWTPVWFAFKGCCEAKWAVNCTYVNFLLVASLPPGFYFG